MIAVILFCVLSVTAALTPDEVPLSAKEFTRQLSSYYTHESKRTHLPSTRGSVFDENIDKPNLYEISNNRLLDTEIEKKSTNKKITKKDVVDKQYQQELNKYQDDINNIMNYKAPNMKQRQSIADIPIEGLGPNVGKAYGDPDTYQSIGDGVYLMKNQRNSAVNGKHKIKTLKGNLPDTAKTLSAILGNLDNEDKNIVAQEKSVDTTLPSAYDSDISTTTDASVTHSLQANSVGTSSNEDLEGMVPTELSMLNDLQKDLKADDQRTTYFQNASLPAKSNNGESDDIAKSIENDDKNFIKENPFAIDPDISTGANMIKKDITADTAKRLQNALSLKNSEALRFIDNVNNEDDKIKMYAGADTNADKLGLDIKNYDDSDRAKNIVNLAAQEDAEILVGGSRSHKSKKFRKRRKRIKRKKRPLARFNTLKQDTIDAEALNADSQQNKKLIKGSISDTGFFMADEGDIADLNKKTEDFVSNTVNASFVNVIMPDDEKNTTTANIKHIFEDIPPINNTLSETLSENKTRDNQDKKLFETLNKTDISKPLSHHKSGSVWKVSNFMKPTKIINVAGKPGVQIDLYITKGQKAKKRKNVRKANTPKATGSKRYLSLSDDGYPDEEVEDVSVSEAVANQEKQMFGTSENVLDTDKTNVDEIQTSHVEGNEAKQNSDVNVQEAINSEELKTAMKESDLKGLNQIKNELDLQDAKNTVDFFDQPNSGKPILTHHLSSTNINDLSDQLKDAESGLANKEEKEISKAKLKEDEENPQKVKIILHIPESISKEKETDANTQEALDLLTEQAKAFLTTDQAKNLLSLNKKEKEKVDQTTLETAKKIEEFIKAETVTKNDENNKVKEEISQFTANKLKTPSLVENKNGDDNLIKALLSSGIHDISIHPTTTIEGDDKGLTAIKEESAKNVFEKDKENTKPVEEISNALKESNSDHAMSLAQFLSNPHPTEQSINNFIKTTHEQVLSKTSLLGDEVVPEKQKLSIQTDDIVPLRINGGKVLGGNVRGGNILGGTISGGDVSGGEIQGGKILGGQFKNGLFIDGEMKNGVVEGGKIKGGVILGGDIKSGEIDGGTVSGGIVEGGHLTNGTIEGGDFKGGEIRGGRLLSGEMDGGILKNGTINGGIMKGGVIESGELNGGIMFAGILRGGVVKSGIIRGGIIDKGVVVQDAEIGPGVEIHDGIVNGGRITVNNFSIPVTGTQEAVPGTQEAMFNNPSVTEGYHTDENRSNIMYSIEVLPKPTEDALKATLVIKDYVNRTGTVKPTPTNEVMQKKVMSSKKAEKQKAEDKAFLEKSLKTMNGGVNPNPTPKPFQSALEVDIPNKRFPTPKITRPAPKSIPKASTPAKQSTAVSNKSKYPAPSLAPSKKKNESQGKEKKIISNNIPDTRHKVNLNNISDIKKLLQNLEANSVNTQNEMRRKEEESRQKIEANAKRYADAAKRTANTEKPVAHWELSGSKNNFIKGFPGVRLRMSEGVIIHHGHAILDGVKGYLDAGDYQGECFSDPEACVNGFTIQMTLKIYRDSVFSSSKLSIIDSGGSSKDSRGISIWVSDGRIAGVVTTRKQTRCLHKILEPFIEKWMTLTVTWRMDKGLSLYINCDLFDESQTHMDYECEQCEGCHKTDVATRLMFGRPNKGPHFKVTHMAIGDIALYEKYFDKDEVKEICGSKEDNAVSAIVQSPSQQAVAPLPPPQTVSVVAPLVETTTAPQIQPEAQQAAAPPPQISSPELTQAAAFPPQTVATVSSPADAPPPKPASLYPLVSISPGRKANLHVEKNYFTKTDEESPQGWPTAPILKRKVTAQSSTRGDENVWPTPALNIARLTQPTIRLHKSLVDYSADRRTLRLNHANRHGTIPVMRLEYGTKKSDVPIQQPMIIVNGEQASYKDLESAFEQLKHKR